MSVLAHAASRPCAPWHDADKAQRARSTLDHQCLQMYMEAAGMVSSSFLRAFTLWSDARRDVSRLRRAREAAPVLQIP